MKCTGRFIPVKCTGRFIFLPLVLVFLASTISAAAQDVEEQENECVPQEWLVVSNGYSEPDINAATALVAGDDKGASTIVNKDSVPGSIRSHLEGKYAQDSPAALYIIGGEEAVSTSVVEELQEILSVSSDSTIRLGGETRFETFVAADGIEGPCELQSSSQ